MALFPFYATMKFSKELIFDVSSPTTLDVPFVRKRRVWYVPKLTTTTYIPSIFLARLPVLQRTAARPSDLKLQVEVEKSFLVSQASLRVARFSSF